MLYYCALVRSNKVHSTYKKSCRFLLICNIFCTFAKKYHIMATNRKITIFLASSEELINDRNSFHSLISTLDDIYEDRGIRIKLKRWEDFFAYCTGNRTQDEYNQVLSASDMCICLFHKRAGQYTVEEFHHAIAEYQRTGDHPKTYVYARAIVEGEVEEEELKQFKDELFKQMGHYWCNYATEDSMKLHFVMQFERLMNGDNPQDRESNIQVNHGIVSLHGKKVADYNNIPFAANNTEVIALKEKIAALDKDIVALRSIGNDALTPMINDKLSERHQCQEQLEQLEKQLLDTALSISKMISSDKPISERKRAAIEMFEQGNNKGVLDILNEEEIERDYQSAKRELQAGQALIEAGEKAKEAARDKIRSLVEEYLLKAKTWMSTYSEANRLEEACKCYEQAIARTRESLTEEELAKRLFDYGKFLQDNNQFHKIETYYQEGLDICERLAKAHPETYGAKVALTLNNLAALYSNTQRFDQAEEYFLRALEIYERLAKAHPEAYEAYVAMTLNNLALLYKNTQRFDQAEEYFLRALEIYERLAKAYPEAYVATTLNNLALLYSDTQRFDKAEEYYLRALEIYERLAKAHPEAYEAYVAMTLNNLALLYSDTQRFDKAEEYYLRALEIRERLANSNPEAYEAGVAQTLVDLAILYYKTQRFDQAEEYFLRALEIYERLAKAHPEAYEAYVATTLNNLALLYSDTQRFDKAEAYYLRALEIRERLAKAHPEAYEADVATTLNNLGALYSNTQRFDQAEVYYLRALEIRERLAKAHPEAYEANVAKTLNNLAVLYYNTQRFDQAEEYFLRALEIYERLASQWPEVYASDVQMVQGNLRILEENNQGTPKTTLSFWERLKRLFT